MELGTETIALGRYRLLMELAAGGMATAYVARVRGAAGFERLVVVKRVHRHLVRDRDFHDMFIDEAKLASLVRHPNVVPVIDVTEDAGELFLVLEYVESVSLSRLILEARNRGERIPPAVVSRIVLDMLSGLHAAHQAKDIKGEPLNIVHRDVSPQNVIVGADGMSRLIDFGIAKAAGRLAHTTGSVMKGKLGYMAPEQARQKPLDRRADVFAAGVVLHEALSGQRLFSGDDAGDILLNMLVAEVPVLAELDPKIPAAVDSVLEMALARDPEERFDNAAAFESALELALPPAPSRDVSALVQRLAGAELQERHQAILAALEESGASETLKRATARKLPRLEERLEEPGPVTDVSHVLPPAIDGRRLAMRGVGVLLVLATLGGVAMWWRHNNASPAASPEPAASTDSDPDSATPDPSAAPSASSAVDTVRATETGAADPDVEPKTPTDTKKTQPPVSPVIPSPKSGTGTSSGSGLQKNPYDTP